jgi:hypothetical protein
VPSLAYDLLDGALAFLTLDLEEVLAPVTLASSEGRALPLYTDAATADAQARSLRAARSDARSVVRRIEASDVRAKQELLRAARALGAAHVAFDPGPGAGGPRATLSVDTAIAYLEGHKRNSACL